ncbi:MAG: desulfoferrodoxin [Thermoguttaceae bacterium]|nr:desulfoferrodoxin [Thermoguttaceae bacterium]
MTELGQIYLCQACGNVVEVVHASQGTLTCCDSPMTLQVENSGTAATAKHVPFVQKEGNRVFVQVGSIPHPMCANHYIHWIELSQGNRIMRVYLKPDEEPKAEFCVDDGDFTVSAYCNVHGLWKV